MYFQDCYILGLIEDISIFLTFVTSMFEIVSDNKLYIFALLFQSTTNIVYTIYFCEVLINKR